MKQQISQSTIILTLMISMLVLIAVGARVRDQGVHSEPTTRTQDSQAEATVSGQITPVAASTTLNRLANTGTTVTEFTRISSVIGAMLLVTGAYGLARKKHDHHR